MIPDKIADISRRTLRYILFQRQRIVLEGGKAITAKKLGLTSGQVKAVEEHFFDSEFTPETFTKLWDIGIDDIGTMVNRPEKYWLFGISRFQKVKRPVERVTLLINDKLIDHDKVWADSAHDAFKFFEREGFVKTVSKDTVIDYDKIMELAGSRITWLERA